MSSQPIPGLPVFSPQRFRSEIDRHLLTNAEVAQRIGVTEKTVIRWRQGEVEPRRKNVRRMAEAFRVEPISFYDEPNGKAT